MSDFSADGMATSLYIEPILCSTLASAETTEDALILYPNPASAELILKMHDDDPILNVQLLGIDGNIQSTDYQVYSENILLDISSLPAAPYVVAVSTKKKRYMRRFLKL